MKTASIILSPRVIGNTNIHDFLIKPYFPLLKEVTKLSLIY
jgi:hypothetical protein